MNDTKRYTLGQAIVYGAAIGGGGGASARVYTNFMPELLTENYNYSRFAPLSETRERAVCAVVDGIAYIIGGDQDDAPVFNTNIAYNLATGERIVKTVMPTARRNAAWAIVGKKIYIIGGADASFNELVQVEVYDTENDTWDTSFDNLALGYESSCAAHVNGKIYLLGGKRSTSKNQHQSLDLTTKSWSTETVLPYSVSDFVAVSNGIYIYITGSNSKLHRRYDTVLKTWSNMTSLPNDFRRGCGGIANGFICYMHGSYDAGTSMIYDIGGNSFNEITTLPFTELLEESSYAMYNNRLYIFGGIASTVLQTINSSFSWVASYAVNKVPSGTKVLFDKIIFDGTINHIANVEFTTTAEVQLSSFETDLTGTITYP
jgi:N-acetylneuraminic acid mutarotase